MNSKSILENLSPKEALQKLIDGNTRFRQHQYIERDFKQEVKDVVEEQYPFAIILGCIDSRVPVEILFDQGVGDLFVTRIAGNFENEDVIAGMEYACKVVGSKLIMVLGHQDCGAIKAACDDVQLEHISKLITKIKPAIVQTDSMGANSSKNKKDINNIAKTNVKLTIQRIQAKSEILRTLVANGEIQIVGAYYELSTQKVIILNI